MGKRFLKPITQFDYLTKKLSLTGIFKAMESCREGRTPNGHAALP